MWKLEDECWMRGYRSTGYRGRCRGDAFQPELRLDEGNQGLRPEHLQGALQVVGQDVQAHFGAKPEAES